MRIAYLTGQYPRATDTFVQREVAALRELGVEIQTFAIRRPHDKETVGPEQAAERARTLYLLPCNPLALLAAHLRLAIAAPRRYFRALRLALRTAPPGPKALAYQLFYFAEAALLARHLNRLGIPHLHNHFANSSCSVAMIAAEMGGFTYSFTMHGPAIFFEPKYWRIDEKIRRALFVSCISHFCRSQGMIFAPLEAWDRMHVVHCGVDPSFYVPAAPAGEGTRLLYVGRIAAVKGLPTLLRALADLRARRPGARLAVVGDGPDRARLEAMARDLGLADAVEFLGYRSQAQVRDHLRDADVFVMSSFAEGVPVVLMEAMATGIPVVATRVAGVGELVEEAVSGYTVPPGDPAALADRIEALLADGALRARFGAAGRARVVDQFDVRKEAAKLHRILASTIPGGNAT
jgi:colanic acid/amylovoran biosynthesis glycosyltransferase